MNVGAEPPHWGTWDAIRRLRRSWTDRVRGGFLHPGRGSAPSGRNSESDRRPGVPGPRRMRWRFLLHFDARSRTRSRSRVVGDAGESCVHGPGGWRQPCFPDDVGDERGRRDAFLGCVRQRDLVLCNPRERRRPVHGVGERRHLRAGGGDLRRDGHDHLDGCYRFTEEHTGNPHGHRSSPRAIAADLPGPGGGRLRVPGPRHPCRGRQRPDLRRGAGGADPDPRQRGGAPGPLP